MCGRIEMVFELDETFNSKVKFRNDTTVPIKDKGKFSIKLKNGSQNLSLMCYMFHVFIKIC